MTTETDGTVVVIAPGSETEAEHEGDVVAEGVEIAETIIETARQLQQDDRRVEFSMADLHNELARQGEANAAAHREIFDRLDSMGNLITNAAVATIETVEELADTVDEEEHETEVLEDVIEDVIEEVADEINGEPEKRTRKRRFI